MQIDFSQFREFNFEVLWYRLVLAQQPEALHLGKGLLDNTSRHSHPFKRRVFYIQHLTLSSQYFICPPKRMDDSVAQLDELFQEPSGYYQDEKPHTFAKYRTHKGEELKLRLVGQSPLWVCPMADYSI